MPRLSFKPDSSFFRKIVIGAVGAQVVCQNLESFGHVIYELENGSTDTKIWKDVKRKRVRIPDLVCTKCGLRIESRAKTRTELAMSHSATDAERAWDFGMVDSDVIAFPICQSITEFDWSRGQLKQGQSYWHGRDRVHWVTNRYINYVRVVDFRQVLHSRSSTKGVVEGSETSISWNTIFSTRKGIVESIHDGKISVRRDLDGHLYTWQNPKKLPVVVREGQLVDQTQILASLVTPIDHQSLQCSGSLSQTHISNLLASPERTQRLTGIKLARLRGEPQFIDLVNRVALHPEEDIYVQLEGVIYLTRVDGQATSKLIAPYLSSPDEQIQLEAIVALAESATVEAVEILGEILDHDDNPYFLRSAAAWALGRIGTDESISRLIQAFADVDYLIREEALDAIEALGESALNPLLTNLADDHPAIAAGAAEAIRRHRLVSSRIIQDIVQRVKADSQHVWAVWLLGNLPQEKEYVKTIVAELQDTRPEAHYAITVLWAFVESWIARHWELNPSAEEATNE